MSTKKPDIHFDNGWRFRLSMLTILELIRLRELIDEDIKEREEFY